jgi:hypothetical protein
MKRDSPVEHKPTSTSALLPTETELFGESRFGDPEFVLRQRLLHPKGAVLGTGLSVSGLQSVAHRQLVGSIVVVAIIAAVSAFVALQPVHGEATDAPAHSFVVVRQAAFVTSAEHILAMKR